MNRINIFISVWKCVKYVGDVVLRFSRLREYQAGSKGEKVENEEGLNAGKRLDAREQEVLDGELEDVWERVLLHDGTAISVAGDIIEHEKAHANDSIPFLLFNACCQLSVQSDIQAIKGRVAVVARGVCDFAQKVAFMQNAGAVGVVVVNREGDKQLANMKVNETKKASAEPIKIPAVMISYDDWLKILPCRNETNVIFTDQGEATFDMDYGREALNWAMMRGMALWILCQCGVNVVRYKRRVSEFRARADAIAALPVDTYARRQGHRDEETNPTEDSLQEDGVSEAVPSPNRSGPALSCPVHDHDPECVELVAPETESASLVSPVGPPPPSASTVIEDDCDTEEEEPVCAVCLEDFETGQQVRKLACSHLYHRSCIDPWLQSSSNSCPLCKREVPNLPPPPAQLHYGSMNV